MNLCQICSQNPATVHLTDIHNNVKRELHMCEKCAAKKGFAIGQSIQIPDIVSPPSPAPAEDEAGDLTCERCGMNWTEFRTRGRFGCAHDYDTFRERLAPLLADIHARAETHVGKSPRELDESGRHRRDVMECRRRLRDAVDREDYEEAARLRDELKAIEGHLREGE